MSGFYSTHQFMNGCVTTVEDLGDKTLSIRVQDAEERMLADIVCGEYEALCLAHSILSVVTHPEDDES